MKKAFTQKTSFFYKTFSVLVGISLFLNGCNTKDTSDAVNPQEVVSLSKKTETYDVKVATEWNDLHLSLLETNQSILPPFAARSFGYVNLALYESTVNGTNNVSMLGQLVDFKNLPKYDQTLEYNWGLAANVAQYTLLKELFAKASVADNAKIDALRLKFEKQFKENVSQEIIERSIQYGASVANAIWEYAKLDGSVSADSLPYPNGFVYTNGLGDWQPAITNAKPLLPQWKQIRPFLASNKAIAASAQVPFSYRLESDFFKESSSLVLLAQNLTVEANLKVKKYIGNGDSNLPVVSPLLILNETIKTKGLNLKDAALIYLKSGISVHDATLANWRNKYEKNLVRPITYIKETVNKNWKPVVVTPNTPSFPSLIGTIGGVVSKIIQNELKTTAFQTSTTATQNVAEFKSLLIDTEVMSGTNFKMCGNSGFSLGENVVINTNKLKYN